MRGALWAMSVAGACMLASSALAQQAVRPAAEEPPQKPIEKPADKSSAKVEPKHADQAKHALPPFPHPLISEVLFAVPSGDDGEMTGDGVRSATGEEFVELVNPHDKPIELQGYRVVEGQVQTRRNESSDSRQRESERLDFVFPKLQLQPGEVVVIFSGFETAIVGTVGTREQSGEPNEHFGNARVFSFGATSRYQALSNSNDMVQLIAPSGDGVQALAWDFRREERSASSPSQASTPSTANQPADQAADKGTSRGTSEGAGDGSGVVRAPSRNTQTRDAASTPKGKPPATSKPAPTRLPKHADAAIQALQTITDPTWREGSLQRDPKTGAFVPHTRLDGTLASPGRYTLVKQ